jgi:hypothetical protein
LAYVLLPLVLVVLVWHVEQYHAMDLLTFDYTSVLATDACFFDLIDTIDVIDMLDM